MARSQSQTSVLLALISFKVLVHQIIMIFLLDQWPIQVAPLSNLSHLAWQLWLLSFNPLLHNV